MKRYTALLTTGGYVTDPAAELSVYLASDVDRLRTEGRERVNGAVPTNWTDSLLTGPNAVIHDAPPSEIEALLIAVRKRVWEAFDALFDEVTHDRT